MKPEYRKIRLLQLTPGMMDKFISIDEKEINDTYEFEKNKYDQPEERELLQILFKSKEEAQNALTTLTPENFEKTALDMGQSIESTYFGMTKKEQLSETLQEPVFNVAANSITQPIETEMGWQIFFVKNIKAAQKADENVVKAEIKKSLINNKAYDKLAEISRKVEDLLGEGKNLTDTAKELTLETIEMPLLDISGIDAKGVTNTVVSPALMQEVFTLNVGDISSLVEHNNGYLIGEVVEIDPVGVKPFDQVKEDVVKLFISEKQKEKFETTVQALAQKAIKGTTLEKLSQGTEGSFKLEKAEKLTRTTENNLFKAHIQTIFNQKTGLENTSFVIAPNKQGAAIITVTSIQLPDFNDKNVDLTATQTNEKNINANALNEAVFNDYMNKLNVKVYQKAIGQIASMYKNQE